MYFLKSHSLLKEFENGLQWKQFLPSPERPARNPVPTGAFVTVPQDSLALSADFLSALYAEGRAFFGERDPKDVHLEGDSLADLPTDLLREMMLAVSPGGKCHFGIDINPARLGPGDVARYRSVGIDRFCLQLFAPCETLADTVRRARALGAYVSVELRLDGFLEGRDLKNTVATLFEAAPSAVCLYDDRLGSLYDNAMLDQITLVAHDAGYAQRTAWLWGKQAAGFDRWAGRLSGRYAGLGPCATNCETRAFRINPTGGRWVATRLAGEFPTYTAPQELRDWLGLAEGLYALRVTRDGLNADMLTRAAALESMGIIDERGRPNLARLMDFHHGVARYLTRVLDGRNQQIRLTAQQNAEAGDPAEAKLS